VNGSASGRGWPRSKVDLIDTEVVNNPDESRYEIRADGALAGFAEYQTDRHDRVVFVHTEIDPAHEGEGLGGKLARGALDDVRAQGRPVVPLCPFIAGYIGKHPEYLDLVAPEYRERVAR
jgi:uncharacterized protein